VKIKSLAGEFMEFINKGNVVATAVGLVLALYFKTIVDKFIEGIITPIVAAIAGETNYASIGFSIGESFISIGLVIGAVIDFLVVGFVLFLVVKAYGKFQRRTDDAPAPTEVELLTEIRDALRNR
jgi:large conductance mechanosensitive channel